MTWIYLFFLISPLAPMLALLASDFTTTGTLRRRGQINSNSSCRPFKQWRSQIPQTM